MLELLCVILVVISVGLYMRLRELESRVDVFDQWADWIEGEFLNPDKDLIFELDLDLGEEDTDGGKN
jgi:hypothetical protein